MPDAGVIPLSRSWPRLAQRIGHDPTLRVRFVDVAGRTVRYVEAGPDDPTAPVVLFLHGWGMRPDGYHALLHATGANGCRVVAPGLPGFGGSDDVPIAERSFRGYAAALRDFLSAIGVERVATVAGHSFGGGVAIQYVHSETDGTTGLVAMNAVGSPTWTSHRAGERTMAERHLLDWVATFGAEVFAHSESLRMLPDIVSSVAANLLSNPLGYLRPADFIRAADLTAPLRSLSRRGAPVEIFWSDRDALIPRTAFEVLRRAASVPGTVVPGAHSWMLCDPVPAADAVLACLVALGDLLPGQRPEGAIAI